MNKVKIKHATITDRIYIKEEDIVDLASFKSAYTYLVGDDIFQTYDYDEEKTLYSVPSNSYKKLNFQ